MRSVERSWMYKKLDRGVIRIEFIQGVEEFIEVAKRLRVFVETSTIRCPCRKCKNMAHHKVDIVKAHLYHCGFVGNYFDWTSHGEQYSETHTTNFPTTNQFESMVVDGLGGWEDSDDEDEEPNEASKDFFEMLSAAHEPLYEGCKLSLLQTAARITNLKCEYNMPHRCVDALASLVRDILPDDNVMTETFYETKKLLRALQLPHKRIHCCPNGCMLYYKGESEFLDKCTTCGVDRWRESTSSKRIPQKVLTYLPITPRLQRLYATQSTAEQMCWHSKNNRLDGKMGHPSDAEAWKHFDHTFPDFSSEARNVRLGLCTDGFAAYGKYGKSYSSWPVILTPYNLPPWMCMKREFMFLSLIIPGPKSPKGNLHVYMEPLIEELKNLWSNGALTYDVSTKRNFTLRAALMWTINDFPAYGMLSSWSTAGKTACPVCMHQTRGTWLENSCKVSWFDTHRQFLPTDHPFRSSKTSFLRNRVDHRTPPSRLSGDDLLSNEATCKVLDSVFWQLPYWSKLLIRHNLDVMHIEKNVFEQLMNIVLDVTGRTVDTHSSRRDVAQLCRRVDLELVVDDRGRIVKPRAPYAMGKTERKAMCEWVKSLKFPDGYASDLSRCVDMKECRLFGMKSHDCRIFMERLLPVAFKHLLPPNVWKACTEISLFFRELCSTTIDVADMVRLEEQIPEILCKLEKIFPPSFFNSMEHLPIHLPYEARVGGPVQYRWMYPFERFLNHIKKKIGNKARVEGSICKAYLLEETSTFCTNYFGDGIDSKSKDLPRNVYPNASDDSSTLPELFRSHGGYALREGKSRFLDDKEFKRAHLYVLENSGILSEYESAFEEYIMEIHPNTIREQVWGQFEETFPEWLREHVMSKGVEEDLVRSMAMRPSRRVRTFRQYYINGFSFQTFAYGKNKSTMNYGVSVDGEDGVDYYGILEDILELSYTGEKQIYKTILFKCSWMDPVRGTNVHHLYKLVEVNHNRKYPKYDPFVLAHQVNQVYFTPYPALRRDVAQWWAVFKTKARSTVDATNDPVIFQEESNEQPLVLSGIDNDPEIDSMEEDELVVMDDQVREYGVDEDNEFEDEESEFEDEENDSTESETEEVEDFDMEDHDTNDQRSSGDDDE